jgi:tetratricopeptide (TPR) repeat protein
LTSLALASGLWAVMPPRAAGAAAALFAVHPLHTDAVTSIVGRADVWAALACMIVWWLHRRPARAATAAAPLAFAIGLLSKESAIAVLPLLALSDWRAREVSRPARALRWAGYAAAIAIVFFARRAVVGVAGAPPATAANALAGAPAGARLVSGLGLFGRGVELLIAPFNLLPDYGPAIVMPSWRPDARVALGVVALAALAIFAARAWRRRAFSVEAAAWLGWPALLACNLILVLPGAFAERWWYWPSAGACALGGLAFDRAATRAPRLARTTGALLLAGLATLTILRNRDWRSDEALFTEAVATDPRGAFAWYRLGLVREEQRRLDDALTAYQRACAITPEWGEAQGARATLLAMAGRADEADAAFRAMRQAGASTGARMNYVRFLAQQGRRDEAERELRALRADSAEKGP